jgi:hypothetical protein
MRKGILMVLFLSLLLLMPACQSNQSPSIPEPSVPKPPISESKPKVTLESITIHMSSDKLYVGTSEVFTATAKWSDGTTTAVTDGPWFGDNPKVATVEKTTGRVTIVGEGWVFITVNVGTHGTGVYIQGVPRP